MNNETISTSGTASSASPEPRWRPLSRVQRRVAGVLVEKAKTTPDAYPLTLNALTTGCNQKSNRSPQMSLSTGDVELVVDELREMGAVIEVQSGSRVAKYRHTLYDWLDVNKLEMAVMAELLLRGEQTVGELRSRASRMEPIADLSALHPVLDSLVQKGLVVQLTPSGRGQIVTHALFSKREMEELRQRTSDRAETGASAPAGEQSAPTASRQSTDSAFQEKIEALQEDIAALRLRVGRLEAKFEKTE